MRQARAAQRPRGGLLRLLALLAVFVVSLVTVTPRGSYGLLPIAAAVASYQTHSGSAPPAALPLLFSTNTARADHAAFSSKEIAQVATAADHVSLLASASSLSPRSNRAAPSWAEDSFTQVDCSAETAPPATERLYLHLCVLRN